METTYQRFEAKYFINEMEAVAIRSYIEPFTELDPYAGEDTAYTVNSLYLDTPELAMFWSSVMGDKNRLKLRVRAYENGPDASFFFEIKRRVNDAVVKRRVRVRREYVGPILEENEIHSRMLVEPSEKELENLRRFLYYMFTSRAAPRIMVRYRREAYIDRMGLPLRITMDRDLTYLPATTYTPDVWCDGKDWYPLIHVPVILEIKFTERMPPWTHRLIQDFGLSKRSTKKYVTCMKALNGDVRPTQFSPARAFL